MLRLRNHRLSKDTEAKEIVIASLLLNEMINIATEPAVTLEHHRLLYGFRMLEFLRDQEGGSTKITT